MPWIIKIKAKSLKKYIKKLHGFLIKVYQCYFSMANVLFYSKLNVSIKTLKDEGTCYVLGNGPSLKSDILKYIDDIKGPSTFVVNDFAKSEHYELIKPRYYVLVDPSYWRKDVYEEVYVSCQEVLIIINNKTTWPLYLIIPNSAKKNIDFQNNFSKNKNIILIDFNDTTILGFVFFRFYMYKNYFGGPPMKNVLISAIYLSLNIGFKEINLLGSDHSWSTELIVNKNNQVCLADSHFYDKQTVSHKPLRHIYGSEYKMHEILRDFALMFEGYHVLNEYAITLGSQICNKCQHSFIDAFEKR
jgi:hypothetical protein